MKILKGVRGLSWQDGEMNTFIAALQRSLEFLEEEYTYSTLMGLSGAAFRVQIHRTGLCPSGPDATCGFDNAGQILKVLRLDHRILRAADGEKKIKAAVKKSIAAGRPAIAVDLIKVPDWGLIVGFDEQDRYQVLTFYNQQKNRPQPAEKAPWTVYLPGERLGPIDRDQAELSSLFLLKNLLENRSYGPYHTGRNGLERWLEILEQIGKFLAGTGDRREDHLLGNYWNYISLIDARRAARTYLQEEIRCRRFDNDAIYRKMGDLFGQEAEALSAYHIPPPFQDEGRGMLENNNIRQQIEALRRAVELEEKVLKLWERLDI
jgi:hypothetical protein